MRTTLLLDDEVYAAARQRAFEQRRSLGDVVSELARRGLAAERMQAPRRPIGLFDGQGFIADDFDETPPELIDAVERELE